MNTLRILGAASAVLAVSFITAPVASAGSTVAIERQCDRYGNFCGPEHVTVQVPSRNTVARSVSRKHVVRGTRASTRYFDRKPFIERQCHRFGHFC